MGCYPPPTSGRGQEANRNLCGETVQNMAHFHSLHGMPIGVAAMCTLVKLADTRPPTRNLSIHVSSATRLTPYRSFTVGREFHFSELQAVTALCESMCLKSVVWGAYVEGIRDGRVYMLHSAVQTDKLDIWYRFGPLVWASIAEDKDEGEDTEEEVRNGVRWFAGTDFTGRPKWDTMQGVVHSLSLLWHMFARSTVLLAVFLPKLCPLLLDLFLKVCMSVAIPSLESYSASTKVFIFHHLHLDGSFGPVICE